MEKTAKEFSPWSSIASLLAVGAEGELDRL
jgi:hypothetical protein